MSITLHLRLGDCVEVLNGYADASIGAVVCDPPYEISFMSRGWDATGIAYDPRLWNHLYRVLVPGGVVKAFSATRTFHRMAAAMQRAGFTGLGMEAWSYGAGFPKSMSISKAIDKAAGAEQTIGSVKIRPDGTTRSADQWSSGMGYHGANASPRVETIPATDAARTWEGWGTALKPSWEPVVVGRKPE